MARVWRGTTTSGIPIQALVLQVAVPDTERQDEFLAELHEVHNVPVPSGGPEAYPLGLTLDDLARLGRPPHADQP